MTTMQKLSKKTILVAVALIALLILLQFVFTQPKPPLNAGIAVGGTLSNLHFESSSEGERIKALDRCISDFASGWKAVGYEEIGNFYEKSWCTGAGSDSQCKVSESNAHDENQHVITLYTLHYNDPVFFGEGFSMVNVPETGWSSSFTFDENGKTITGEGFQFSFDYLNGSGRQEPVFFGSSNSYAVYEKKVYYTSEMPLRVGLEGFLSSPELMRDNALKQLDALSNSVREYLNSSSAVRCEYGPYLGHGIPPACNERALNASERQEQEKIARAYFLRQKSVVGGHYNELYGSLMEAFPFGKCWK